MRTVVVMPAYYAEKTLETTFRALPRIFDEVILCDDGSLDQTYETSQRLGITSIRHEQNRGYGGNQKTLYRYALATSPDVIIMVHPDNQYQTSGLPSMVEILAANKADIVLGNRIPTAKTNQMPSWKFIGNRFLTWCQNRTFKSQLSEFHTGLRVYNADVFKTMPYESFSDDFVFDSELLAWSFAHGKRIAEVPVECYYADDVSSINFRRSVKYGFQTLATLVKFMSGHYKRYLT